MNLRTFKVGILDRYIIKNFLSTYIGIIMILVVVIVIFDMTEKLDDLMESGATFRDIMLEYYVNFAPSLINRFSSLITFIATMLFTSRMAYNTEIVAILASGVSFKRLLYPYFLASILICAMSMSLDMYVIPKSNIRMNAFLDTFTKKGKQNNYETQIYRQISDDTFFSLKGYSSKSRSAELLVLETYKDSKIEKSLMARSVSFNTRTLHWTAPRYITRTYEGGVENLVKHEKLDTMINLTDKEIGKVENYASTLNINELNVFIKEQKAKGSDKVPIFEVNRQGRIAYPLAVILLTVIAVSLSSRKVRGGTGAHMALGLGLCFGYILLMQLTNEFGKGGVMSPILAVWLPNIIYFFIAIYVYHKAPK